MKAYSPSAYPRVIILIFCAASLSFPQSPKAPATNQGKPAQKTPASAEDFTRKDSAAEKASREVLSLPMFPELTDAQIQRVVEVVKKFFNHG